MDGDDRLINYFRWGDEASLLKLYTPEARQQLAMEFSGMPMLDFLKMVPEKTQPLNKMLALEQRFFLADHNLIYTDKMSMASGVEVRVPFLDLEMVEFAAHIPVSLKQKNGEGKWILKKAMEEYLPPDIIYRKKTGFGAPIRRWMRGELKNLLSDMLSAESLRKRGIFDVNAVQKLISDNCAGKVDGAYTLLSLLCIELWCRQYFDDYRI